VTSLARFVGRHGVTLTIIGVSLVVLPGGYAWWWHQRYPYGWSHCCDKQLMFALADYARAHDGAFPAGGETSEASLSLLYPDYADANLLRGKTIPLEVVEPILAGGGRLGPETCGWHYVEGLRVIDNRNLALCWDKAGLGHNGERLLEGGHWVIFIGHHIDYVPAQGWGQFRREQQELRAALGPGRTIRESQALTSP